MQAKIIDEGVQIQHQVPRYKAGNYLRAPQKPLCWGGFLCLKCGSFAQPALCGLETTISASSPPAPMEAGAQGDTGPIATSTPPQAWPPCFRRVQQTLSTSAQNQRRYLALSKSGLSILVTGANGFVGSHLTEALLALGHQVRCMVRPSSDLKYVRHLPVEWAYTDLCAPEGLRQACQGIDIICHCAALTRALDEESFLRINAEGTRALAQAAIEAAPNLQRFLYVSSQAATGPSRAADDFVDESCPPQPITWYGRSKWAAEQALLSMNGDIPLTIVRPAPVFGPRDQDFYTYFDLVNRRLQLKLGRRERRVSLIYIHDLIDLILLALESEQAVGETYFGCGEPITYEELSAAISRALDKHAIRITLPVSVLTAIELSAKVQERITRRPALLNGQRIMDMRRPYWLCSGEKAWIQLGSKPRIDLEAAVRQTANWYRENKWL